MSEITQEPHDRVWWESLERVGPWRVDVPARAAHHESVATARWVPLNDQSGMWEAVFEEGTPVSSETREDLNALMTDHDVMNRLLAR